MKRRWAIVLLLLLVCGVIFRHPIETHARVLLLVSQEFPQIPVKPLDWVTREPEHRRLVLRSSAGPIVADLFLPRRWIGPVPLHSEPAIVLAFGVRVPTSARQSVLGLGRALARLGYVILWPRLEMVDRMRTRVEEPETLVEGFSYLVRSGEVDRRRISFLGISIGASIALVAAADRRIARRVHGLVFFGGYYDIFDYLVSLATRRARFQGREIVWRPSRDAVSQVKQILRGERAAGLLRLFRARTTAAARTDLKTAGRKEMERLRRFNPADHTAGLSTRVFILHDRGDAYVPYVESEKLDRALPPSVARQLLLTNLFQHVNPGSEGLGPFLGRIVSLYGFVYSAMDYL